MRKKQKLKWLAMALVFTMLMVLLLPAAVHASPQRPIDPGARGSISVYPYYYYDELPGTLGQPGQTPYYGSVSLAKVMPKTAALEGSPNVNDYMEDAGFTPQLKAFDQGPIVFDDLPPGYYLLGDTLDAERYIAPFILRMPMEDPENTNLWLWDIEVYPKFSMAPAIYLDHVDSIPSDFRPARMVSASNPPAEGTELYWEIRAEIPFDIALAHNYEIDEELDSRLHFDYETLKIFAMDRDGKALEIPRDGTCFTLTGSDTEADLQFTAAGRRLLARALEGEGDSPPMLYIQFGTSIHLSDTNQGRVVNNVHLYYTNAQGVDLRASNPPGFDDDAVGETYSIHIIKFQDEAGNQPVEGAGFKLYLNEADANARGRGINAPGTKEEWYIETGADGKIYFNGLAEGVYWLVETTVPSHLIPPDSAWRIELRPGAEGVVNYAYEMNIRNYPKNEESPGPGKPGGNNFWRGVRTGDANYVLPFIGMLCVAGGGLVVLVLYKRRRRNK